MGEKTDTADLVKSLRADALWASQGMQIIAERHTSWQAAAALSSTQARADKLEAELVEAKNITAMLRDNNRELVGMLDDANNRAEAAEKVAENLGEMARQRADELIAIQAELAEAKRERDEAYDRLGEEITELRNDVRAAEARAESAESSLAQANEALKAVNKLIEWERENGTHFVLIDREVEYVSGLWFDAKNAVVDYLKTAGKE